MPDFGFAIQKPRSENADKADLNVFKQLTDAVPSFKRCFQCGMCAATCSARQFTDFNIRMLHLKVRRGDIQGLKEDLKPCMLCGKCTLECPRGVNLRSLIMNMRRLVEEEENK